MDRSIESKMDYGGDDVIIEFQNYNLSILKMALQPQKVSPTGIGPIVFTDKSDLRSYY